MCEKLTAYEFSELDQRLAVASTSKEILGVQKDHQRFPVLGNFHHLTPNEYLKSGIKATFS